MRVERSIQIVMSQLREISLKRLRVGFDPFKFLIGKTSTGKIAVHRQPCVKRNFIFFAGV